MNDISEIALYDWHKSDRSGGLSKIWYERFHQIINLGRNIQSDVLHNPSGELVDAAVALLRNKSGFFPTSWGVAACRKMINKSHKERLIIAGALIAAEIDRLEYLEAQQKLEKPNKK